MEFSKHVYHEQELNFGSLPEVLGKKKKNNSERVCLIAAKIEAHLNHM